MTEAWLRVGQVTGVDAANRRLRVDVTPGREYVFDDCDRIWLHTGHEKPVQARVLKVRDAGVKKLITLTPGVSRDTAAAMKNAEVLMPAGTQPADIGSECPVRAMLGLRIETEDGTLVGVVFETIENAAGGAVRIERPDGATAALPLAPDLIRQVNIERGVVVINDPAPYMVFNDTSED